MATSQIAQERFEQKMLAESGIRPSATNGHSTQSAFSPISKSESPPLPDRRRKTIITTRHHRARTTAPSTFAVRR